MDDGTNYDRLCALFRVLGDPTRAKILLILEKEELCVNCITSRMGVTMSAVSHQLRILRDIGLVRASRSGKSIIYSLVDKRILGMMEMAKEILSDET